MLMKKALLLAAAFAALSVANASAALPKSDYPSGVTIEPAPDSKVDVSANNSPLGVSAIALTFSGGDVDKNPNNTTPAELYLNNFDVPACTTLSTSIDMQTWASVGVIFPGSWNKNGIYKIVIPAGMFLVGGAPSQAMTLYYEIDVAWYAEPVDQMVVSELEEIVLTFPGSTEVKLTDSYSATMSERLGESIYTSAKVDGNRVIISVAQEGDVAARVSQPGQYLLQIGANGIEYVKDGVRNTTDEIRLTYHIPESPEPEIWPFVDEPITSGIEYFEVTAPLGYDPSIAFFANDKENCPLYRADENGLLDMTSPVCIARAIQTECDYERRILYLGLFDSLTLEPLNFEMDRGSDDHYVPYDEWTVVPGSLKPWKPQVTGTYCLVLGQSLYNGYYTSPLVGSEPGFVASAPFRFYYEIEGLDGSGVEYVETAEEPTTVDVYNLTGIRVLKNAPKENVNNLPAGLYIVNGKKVMVK